jgi:threonine dehydrogenase-like Zn-dependent dehydrogenase
MLEVGLCGTDREIAEFEYGTPPAGREHLVIGHEGLGEVLEIGGEVSRVKKGDLVVPLVRRECDHSGCEPCRAFRQDYCETGDYFERGIKEVDGFLTELVVDDEKYLNVVPGNLRDIGVLTEPLTIAEKGLDQLRAVQTRLPWPTPEELAGPEAGSKRAVVLGAGPVGLLGAMLFRSAGFATTLYSRAEAPNDASRLAESFGASYISSSSVKVDEMAEQVGPIDLIYEATGAPNFAFDVLRVLGANGVYIFTGVPPRTKKGELDTADLMRDLVLYNQVVLGTVNASRKNYETAIENLGELSRRWPDAIRELITGRFPLDAYEHLLVEEPGGIKNVIALTNESATG